MDELGLEILKMRLDHPIVLECEKVLKHTHTHQKQNERWRDAGAKW